MNWSTNEKRGRSIRSFNKVISLKYKNSSPKLSPKAKNALKLSHKKFKSKSKDKIEDKIAIQTNKPSKVLELVNLFESNTTVKIDGNKNAKKGEIKDGFEAMMQGRCKGDTQKRTPVRKRDKRLEAITSDGDILKWVTKSGRKGTKT